MLRNDGFYTQDPSTVGLAARACDVTAQEIPVADPPPAKLVFVLVAGAGGKLGADSAGGDRPNDHPCVD